MEKKQWCIYVHINKINQKKYIGQSCNVQQRWGSEGKNYKDSPLFYAAIQKYGWNNFEHIVLKDKIITPEEADYWEQYYIKLYKSNNKQYGYNLTNGGNLCHYHTEETKAKIGAASRRTWSKLTEAEKEKKKAFLKEINQQYQAVTTHEQHLKNTEKGRKASREYWNSHKEEEKKKLDEMRQHSVEVNSKAVYCIETGMIFSSSQAAARYLNKTDGSHIRRSCREKGKPKGYGFHWIFVSDLENYLKKG